MIQAMKRMMALLLAIVMVLLASPFAVLAEGELIEETLTEVTPEETLTEVTPEEILTEVVPEETVPAVPVTNFSNAVSAASLLAAGEKAAEPTYLEQIAALQAEAEALDAESETLQDDCADIYARLMVAYEAAVAEREAGTITEEEYNEIYNATGAVIGILYGYGYDPYATMTGAESGTISYGSNSITVNFIDEDNNPASLSTTSYSMDNSSMYMSSIGPEFESSAYTYVESRIGSTVFTSLRYYNRSWQFRTASGSWTNVSNVSNNTIYLVFKKNVTSETPVNILAGMTATQNINSAPSGTSTINVATGVSVTFNGNVATIATTTNAAAGTYTASWTGTDGNAYEMAITVRPVHTVTFDVGAAAAAAGVAAPSPVTVERGQTISDLPLLTWRDEDGDAVQVFAGWYSDAGLNQEFTSTTAVNADITLYAKWVSLNDQNLYYVNFMNQAGNVVLITLVADENQTVGNYAGAPVEDGVGFIGWSRTQQGEDDDRSDFVGFDFSQEISDIVAPGTNSINLYAWYWDRVTVTFISNGGTAVDSHALFKGDATVAPANPDREGYTFRHWTTDAEGTNPFNFSTPIDQDITLYAVWDPDFVRTTILYMLENANDSDYTSAGQSLTVYAPTGSIIKIAPVNVTNLNAQHNIQYCLNPDAANPTWQNARTTATGGTATLPDVYYDDKNVIYFQYASNSSPDGTEVLPDGTTVIHANYNRARITLTFPNGSGSFDYSQISESDRVKYSCEHTPEADGSGFTYKFTAKLGQSIETVWPSVGWVSGSTSDNKNFYCWITPAGSYQVSNMYNMVTYLYDKNTGDADSKLTIKNGKLVGEFSMTPGFDSTSPYYLIYARTTLPGETPDFTYNNQNYTIYKEACQVGYGIAWFGPKGIDGTDAAAQFAGEYRSDSGSNKGVYVDSNDTYLRKSDNDANEQVHVNTNSHPGMTILDIFKNEFPDTTFTAGSGNTKGSYLEILLYNRKTMTINLHGEDDVVKDVSDSKYLYGDKISNEDSDFILAKQGQLRKDGYRFAGWYTSPDFVDGSQFILNEETCIYNNIELWAKWEPTAYTAEFYLFDDDITPYRTQGFAEGSKLTNWTVPAEIQNSFVGWYYYNSQGDFVPFQFASPVGAGYVDGDGTLKLYGVWKPDQGIVQYLPGEGGNNVTQSVTEVDTSYVVGQAMVKLKDYTSVWPDGTVPNNKDLVFLGWKMPNGAVYQAGKWVLVNRPLMQFEAVWAKKAETVTLTYDANGGTPVTDVVETYPKDYEAVVWNNKGYNDNQGVWYDHFTRENYELIGWDENPNATDPTYEVGKGVIKLDTSKTLYAIWRKCVTDVVIGKIVDGNMGDRNKSFEFNVDYVLDGKKTTVGSYTLKHDGTATIPNIPIGAQITVTETNTDYVEKYVTGVVTDTADKTATQLKTAIKGNDVVNCIATATVAPGTTIIFTNTNDVEVDTGILLDSLPYVLILAVVGAALVLWFIRKRRVED
ncbi:MAG: InlB B-repeat-containing protein [Clostridia bacterium]|nr:InlB B-repeat-containing protein [Clostridia bacterium]